MKGKLLCVEGLDGCGKSTQVDLLAKWLRSLGYPVLRTAEPTKGSIGRLIRKGLREGGLTAEVEALLFAADRMDHASRLLFPALGEGKMVVSERGLYSSIAYQCARGLGEEWIRELNRFSPLPDLTLFLDLPPEECLKRMEGKKLDLFERDLEFQRKVREKYLELVGRGEMERIEGRGSVGEVHERMKEAVLRWLGR
ncbi:MAG: dTMP kinase [Candidatus Hadarchaeales archaeon]